MYQTIFRFSSQRELAKLYADRAQLKAELHLAKLGRIRRLLLTIRLSWVEQKIAHIERLHR